MEAYSKAHPQLAFEFKDRIPCIVEIARRVIKLTCLWAVSNSAVRIRVGPLSRTARPVAQAKSSVNDKRVHVMVM